MSHANHARIAKGESNKLLIEDRPIHEWYRFVLSFPPHLVRDYVRRFGLDRRHHVLDPFCGTGTTLVECKKLGISSVGVEANPVAHFASAVKLDWSLDPDGLAEHARQVADEASAVLERNQIEDEFHPLFSRTGLQPVDPSPLRTLDPEKRALLLSNSISPLPLHKTLVLHECLTRSREERCHRHELLALAKALVYSISNLHFGPEVGVGPPKSDVPVLAPWLAEVRTMADDLRQWRGCLQPG